MKLLTSLKEMKLGQVVAWRFLKIIEPGDEPVWLYITKVKGFNKKTTYPQKPNGMVYQSQEYVNFEVLTEANKDVWGMDFLLGKLRRLKRGIELETTYTYDNQLFEAWLIEDEQDHLQVLKGMLVESL